MSQDELDLFEDEDLPPFLTIVKNGICACGRIFWAIITLKRVSVSDKVRLERLDTCSNCEFLINDIRCSKCGCYISPKSLLTTETCPQDKW